MKNKELKSIILKTVVIKKVLALFDLNVSNISQM